MRAVGPVKDYFSKIKGNYPNFNDRCCAFFCEKKW